jgi:hypothetical protein
MRFALNLSLQSVGRIMQGQVQNRQETQRAFVHIIFPDAPWIISAMFVGCASQRDHYTAQEFLTSGKAQSDMQILPCNVQRWSLRVSGSRRGKRPLIDMWKVPVQYSTNQEEPCTHNQPYKA